MKGAIMKHKLILLLSFFLLIAVMPVLGQNNRHKHFDVDKFKKERAEYIIREVGLTDAEAKSFIPLADELMDKRFELNHNVRSKARQIREKKAKTDQDYTEMLESGFDLRIKEVELDKEYYQKFKKILSPEKIYKFQRAESKFMKEMFSKKPAKR